MATPSSATASALLWVLQTGTSKPLNLSDTKVWHGTKTASFSFVADATNENVPFRVVVSNENGSVISDAVKHTLATDEIIVDNITYEIITETTCRVTSCANNFASITIPETVEGMTVVEIGPSAFEGNSNLTSIDLPDTITIIGKRAFAGCTNLSRMS